MLYFSILYFFLVGKVFCLLHINQFNTKNDIYLIFLQFSCIFYVLYFVGIPGCPSPGSGADTEGGTSTACGTDKACRPGQTGDPALPTGKAGQPGPDNSADKARSTATCCAADKTLNADCCSGNTWNPRGPDRGPSQTRSADSVCGPDKGSEANWKHPGSDKASHTGGQDSGSE